MPWTSKLRWLQRTFGAQPRNQVFTRGLDVTGQRTMMFAVKDRARERLAQAEAAINDAGNNR